MWFQEKLFIEHEDLYRKRNEVGEEHGEECNLSNEIKKKQKKGV